MLPSGTARSMPSTAVLPSKALNRPFASIAKPFATLIFFPFWRRFVVAAPHERRQGLPASAPRRESGGARLLRVRDRARRRGAAERGAIARMACLGRPRRHAVDGGECGPPRLAGRFVARS